MKTKTLDRIQEIKKNLNDNRDITKLIVIDIL